MSNADAARAIYRLAIRTEDGGDFADTYHGFCSQEPTREPYLQMLRDKARKAAREVDAYERGVAFRAAVDALMPGWVDIDTGGLVPRSDEMTFISDNPGDWRAWLIEHGVEEEKASKLVAQAFGR